MPKERKERRLAAFHKGTRVTRESPRTRYTNMEIKEKKMENLSLQRISRGHRFTRLRRCRRLPHPLLKSTHKTPEWEQQPVQRSRRRFDMRFGTSTRPRFRVIFIGLSLSFLRSSQQSSCINSSRLCRSNGQWRSILRLLRTTGANISGTGSGSLSNRLIQRRTVKCRALSNICDEQGVLTLDKSLCVLAT